MRMNKDDRAHELFNLLWDKVHDLVDAELDGEDYEVQELVREKNDRAVSVLETDGEESMSIEAMRLALEALQRGRSQIVGVLVQQDQDNAIATLRQAIAEAEQAEPVAWITDGGKGELWWYQSEKFDDDGNLIGPNPDDIPLYTHPPASKPLTDGEVFNMAADYYEGYGFKALEFARAIERAHGITSD